MLSVAEAQAAIRDALPAFAETEVALDDACGRVLRQDVLAERDQPPYDRVTMDGIALRHAALAGGRREFRVAATQYAGDPATSLDNDSDCIEIMTGGVLPNGADCVVPVERLQRRNDGCVTIEDDYRAEARQFVHARGSDHERGFRLLGSGRRLEPIDIALLASSGLDRVRVAASPRVRVVSTGNELVPAGQPIADHQVRLSNGPSLVAMLKAQGYADSAHAHLADEPAAMQRALGELLGNADVLVLSGGVSMGKADFVPQVLDELGVEKLFHRVAQRPGKPLWFGMTKSGQAVFALPGNPVSALTCARHYLLPALLEAAGGSPAAALPAVLSADYHFAPALTCFLPVRQLPDAAGRLLVEPCPTNTSGDFTALAATDGYVELPPDEQSFSAGRVVPFNRWDVIQARP